MLAGGCRVEAALGEDNMKKWRAVVLALIAALGLTNPVPAKGYPTKPITLIVSFAAGGPSDATARLIADHMGRTLGEQVIIENVPGAGGTAGAERAAKAAPDGHTILFQSRRVDTSPLALFEPSLRD
jgi:tripartite-type tricarboxylate transporter receptor subunit TctC